MVVQFLSTLFRYLLAYEIKNSMFSSCGFPVRLFSDEVLSAYVHTHAWVLNKVLPISFGRTTMWDLLVYILVGACIRYDFTIARVLVLVFIIKWL